VALAELYDLIKCNIATTGTGTVTFGTRISGFFLPSDYPLADGTAVRYLLRDGVNLEEGDGVVAGSGTQMTRTPSRTLVGTTVDMTSPAAISLSGTATLTLVVSAEDILNRGKNLSDLANAATALNNLNGISYGAAQGSITATQQAQARANAGSSARVHGDVLCPHENLVVKYNNSNSVVITATAVVLFDSNGNGRRFAGLSEIPSITTAGVNGRDAGSEAANTWYHIWAIAKADGTLDTLFSTSASSPTMPTDYIYKGYLGAVRNDAGSDFVEFAQHGNHVTTPYGKTTNTLVNGGSATSFTNLNSTVAAAVPPTATAIDLQCAITPTGTVGTVFVAPGNSSTTTALYGEKVFSAPASGGNAFFAQLGYVDLTNSQTIVYRVFSLTATSLYCVGWRY